MYNGVHRRITRAKPDKLEAIIEAFTSSSSTYYKARHQSIKNYDSLTTAVTICKESYTITSNLLSKLLAKEVSFKVNHRYILSLVSFI